jgi:hypothetical protein
MSDAPRLQLRITLEGIEPRIWRRVIITASLTFAQLHRVIQRAMGWEDAHLHEFQVGKLTVGTRSGEDLFFGGPDRAILPETRTRLDEVLAGKRKFRYWYDFGDDWWHEIAIEKRLPPDPGVPQAQLVAGERACPPEDCGGPWGYAELVAVLSDPDQDDPNEYRDWLEDYDPEAFDLVASAKSVSKAIRAPGKRKGTA